MPMPGDIDYGMNYANYNMNYGIQEGSCLPLNPPTGSVIPRAYVVDQPYMGLLPYEEGMLKGTIFPNIIFPKIS